MDLCREVLGREVARELGGQRELPPRTGERGCDEGVFQPGGLAD